MQKIDVVLTEHQATLVVEKHDSEYSMRLLSLQSAVQVGLADSSAGRYISFDSPQSLTAHLKSLAINAITTA